MEGGGSGKAKRKKRKKRNVAIYVCMLWQMNGFVPCHISYSIYHSALLHHTVVVRHRSISCLLLLFVVVAARCCSLCRCFYILTLI